MNPTADSAGRRLLAFSEQSVITAANHWFAIMNSDTRRYDLLSHDAVGVIRSYFGDTGFTGSDDSIGLGGKLLESLLATGYLTEDHGGRNSCPPVLAHPTGFLQANFEVTKACPSECAYCQVEASPDGAIGLNEAGIDRVLSLLSDLEVFRVVVTGGDPVCHPTFPHLIRSLACFPSRSVQISGLGLNESQVKLLAEAGLDHVQVSLDGARQETHERFRGQGTFTSVLDAIQRLGRSGVKVRVATVVSNHNVDEIEQIAGLCRRCGVHKWRVSKMYPLGRARTDIPDSHRRHTPTFAHGLEEAIRRVKMTYPGLLWNDPCVAEGGTREIIDDSVCDNVGLGCFAIDESGCFKPCLRTRQFFDDIGLNRARIDLSQITASEFIDHPTVRFLRGHIEAVATDSLPGAVLSKTSDDCRLKRVLKQNEYNKYRHM